MCRRSSSAEHPVSKPGHLPPVRPARRPRRSRVGPHARGGRGGLRRDVALGGFIIARGPQPRRRWSPPWCTASPPGSTTAPCPASSSRQPSPRRSPRDPGHRRGVPRRHHGRDRPRSGLQAAHRAAALLQGLPRHPDPPPRALAVERRGGRTSRSICRAGRPRCSRPTSTRPRAIGRGIFLDHATGLVVGSTAVIEDNVSMLQDVTLGGTGKERGDRHPKIRQGVLIGAGAKILGNIEVGQCARVAAGSVVLKPVPRNTTVAGVPARVVGEAGCAEPARSDGPDAGCGCRPARAGRGRAAAAGDAAGTRVRSRRPHRAEEALDLDLEPLVGRRVRAPRSAPGSRHCRFRAPRLTSPMLDATCAVPCAA